MSMVAKTINQNSILNAALLLAEKKSWHAVRLDDIAKHLNTNLPEIKKYFSDKEAISLAWFDQAENAMLQETKTATFAKLSSEQKIKQLIMAWLAALGKHQQVTKQMLCAKMVPGQIDVSLCFLMRIKKTSRWIAEAADHKSRGCRRVLKEKAIKCLMLSSLCHWCHDHSKNYKKTEQHLNHRLSQLNRIASFAECWIFQPVKKVMCHHRS